MAEGGGVEDYMSDTFLNQLEDIRPGLRTEKQKRKDRPPKHENLPKQKKKKVAENEARECAMSVPLPDDNKGFALLQKMGYKKGMGLGKTGMFLLFPASTPAFVGNEATFCLVYTEKMAVSC